MNIDQQEGGHMVLKTHVSANILNKLLEKRRRCLDLEPLEDRYDVRLWQEGKCHYFSDVLVNGVIRSIRMF